MLLFMLCCDNITTHSFLVYLRFAGGRGSPNYIKPNMDITPYNIHTSFDIWFLLADCGDPTLPMNGVVMAYDSTLEGSQIVFQCSPGFVPSQQMMSVCMADGNWTPNPAELECRGIWLYCDCVASSNYVWPSLLSS